MNVNEPENRKADGPSEVNSLVLVRSVAGEGKREKERMKMGQHGMSPLYMSRLGEVVLLKIAHVVKG